MMSNAVSPILAPSRVSPAPKNTWNDFLEGWKIGRLITAADAAAIKSAYDTIGFVSNQPSGLIPFESNQSMMIRIFSNATGGVVSLQFLSESVHGPDRRTGSNQPTIAMPQNTLVAQFTTSGASMTGFNPITGDVDSTDVWYESSTYATDAVNCDNRVTAYPSGAATNGNQSYMIDPLGDGVMFPFCYGLTTATKVIVAYKKVD